MSVLLAKQTGVHSHPTEFLSEAPPSKKVKWEVEDPSEFRPGILKDIGKDKETFRAFYDVNIARAIASSVIMKVIIIVYLQLSDPRYPVVKNTYTEMYKNQTMETVKARVSVFNAIVLLVATT